MLALDWRTVTLAAVSGCIAGALCAARCTGDPPADIQIESAQGNGHEAAPAIGAADSAERTLVEPSDPHNSGTSKPSKSGARRAHQLIQFGAWIAEVELHPPNLLRDHETATVTARVLRDVPGTRLRALQLVRLRLDPQHNEKHFGTSIRCHEVREGEVCRVSVVSFRGGKSRLLIGADSERTVSPDPNPCEWQAGRPFVGRRDHAVFRGRVEAIKRIDPRGLQSEPRDRITVELLDVIWSSQGWDNGDTKLLLNAPLFRSDQLTLRVGEARVGETRWFVTSGSLWASVQRTAIAP